MKTSDKCELCGSTQNLTKHHLIPQVKCKNKYKAIKNQDENIIVVCETCHRTIHAYFNEQQLRDIFNTIGDLRKSKEFSKYLSWRLKHKDANSPTKMKKIV